MTLLAQGPNVWPTVLILVGSGRRRHHAGDVWHFRRLFPLLDPVVPDPSRHWLLVICWGCRSARSVPR